MQESHRRVQWVYESTSDKDLEDRYDQWAADYDSDLSQEFDWKAPQNATAVFAKHVDLRAHILDAGAGTGLVGECLAEIGYKDRIQQALKKGETPPPPPELPTELIHEITQRYITAYENLTGLKL